MEFFLNILTKMSIIVEGENTEISVKASIFLLVATLVSAQLKVQCIYAERQIEIVQMI